MAVAEPRVLVVDDEEGPREAIRMILKPHYQVYLAASGEEVLTSLTRLRPDVIFMDVKMPRMDGVQLLERVKSVDPLVEVVMITAYASLDTVQRAMRFGAMDYLVKPFAPKELQEAAERALHRRRERVEGPAGALAGLIGQMRDLARRGDPVAGPADLPGLLGAMLREVQRATGAVAASFFGIEPAAVAHSDLPGRAGELLASAWTPRLADVQEAVSIAPGGRLALPWPAGAGLEEAGVRSILVVPLADEGLPRITGHLALYLSRPLADSPPPDLTPLRPVVDLMVTAIRTSMLLAAAARQATEQSLRAVQGEILRQISTAVLEDPALDGTLAAITGQLQHGAGYEQVQVLLEPTTAPPPEGPGRGVFPLVAQGRQLGYLVVEAGGSARVLDRSERELLRMFSESVALIVRNANLHRELSEANSFLQNLIQSAADAIVAVDPERSVVVWNPAAERTFGRLQADVQDRPLAKAIPASVLHDLEPLMAGVGRSRTVLLPGADDGGGLDLTVTCSPIPWGGRGESGLLLVARDVTEQRRWEEQMAQSEKLSALGQLAMGMAHDFNNLLQAILGHAQLIMAEPTPDRLTRGLTTIEQAVRDGVETVARIKRYARREADSQPEAVDLRDVVRQIMDIAWPRWATGGRPGVKVQVEQDLRPVPAVWARGAELREVLMNLVLNAVDAMPKGGTLRLGTHRQDDWAVVTVADTGQGIPEELRRRIFQPFFTTKETGTGLGLSIVSGIISSYGGAIDVESEPGRGTTFTIRLPATTL
jgi:PAS domain S-box-containing protein